MPQCSHGLHCLHYSWCSLGCNFLQRYGSRPLPALLTYRSLCRFNFHVYVYVNIIFHSVYFVVCDSRVYVTPFKRSCLYYSLHLYPSRLPRYTCPTTPARQNEVMRKGRAALSQVSHRIKLLRHPAYVNSRSSPHLPVSIARYINVFFIFRIISQYGNVCMIGGVHQE